MNADFLFLSGLQPSPLRGFTSKVVVQDYECALLYRHGKFVRRLGAGRHRLWGAGHAFARVDLRKATLTLSGQEVLSADQVSLKISLTATFQITDPVKALHEVQNWSDAIYQLLHLSLRSVVSGQATESLLEKRLAIGAELMAGVVAEADAIGVAILSVEVKDVMFPGDLKKAFAEVLKARQEGQAALERARGETAALRSLANAARLLEGNPALQNLRVLQTFAAAGQAGSTLMMGLPPAFVPLTAGVPVPQSQPDVK